MNTQVETVGSEELADKQRYAELSAKLTSVLSELNPLREKSWCDDERFLLDFNSEDPDVACLAQFENGFKFEEPRNIEVSASLGYAPGQYATARFYEEGVSSSDFAWRELRNKQDLLSAVYWYEKADKQGFVLAQGKARKLLATLFDHARSGDRDASYDVALCYETGFMGMVDRNDKAAISWYEKAAEAGHPIASLSLGEIYYFGLLGVDPDEEKAVCLFDQFIQWWEPALHGNTFFHPLCLQRGDMLHFAHAASGAETAQQQFLFNLAAMLYEIEEHNRLELIAEEFVNARVYGEVDDDGEGCDVNPTDWQNRLLAALYRHGKTESRDKQESRDKLRKDLHDLFYVRDDAEVTAVGEKDDPKEDPIFNLTLRTGIVGFGEAFHDIDTKRHVPADRLRCRRMEATLRAAAEDGVDEAGILLGLILVHSSPTDSPDAAEGKGWLEQGVRKSDILSCLWYVSLGRRGLIQSGNKEIKIALKRVIYADFDEASYLKKRSDLEPRKYQNEAFTPEHFQTLRQRAEHQLADIEREEAERSAREQAQRDMLSYLTHTLNNTLSSGPESARQAMRILGSELYEDKREYKAINNIASMFSTFLFAQQLLKTFKLYIADPDALRKNWDSDTDGEATITVVLSLALRQTLSQLVFSANHQASLQRLLPHKTLGAIKNTRKSFMEEVVPLDVDAGNTSQVFDWIATHLDAIRVSVDPAAELHFQSNSTRFTFFFSSFSELIYNALKYSDGARPIEVAWESKNGEFVFRCRNTWSEDSLQSAEGSGRGLIFLSRLVAMLGADLETRREGDMFEAEIRFSEPLIEGKQ